MVIDRDIVLNKSKVYKDLFPDVVHDLSNRGESNSENDESEISNKDIDDTIIEIDLSDDDWDT